MNGEKNRMQSMSPTKHAIHEGEAIVLMAHGSRDVKGANEFLTFARRLSARLACPIYAGFLELSDPPVVTAIDEAVQAGASTILAIPWLLVGAGHVKNDFPAAIQWARQRYAQVQIRYGTPIDVQPELISLLGERLAAIDPDNGAGSAETAVLLVQRGSSDPAANAEVYRAARLLWEGRAYLTIEVAFSGITRPSLPEGLQRCLALGARRVLVVPYFLYTGILVERISCVVAEFATNNPTCDFRIARHLGQDSRLEILAQRMIEQLRLGKVTMNCDLCQYRVPLFGRETRVSMPQVSDHAHGLRGTMMSQHTHTSDMDAHYEHEHRHHTDQEHYEHEHRHDAATDDPWQALRACVVAAGIMTQQEITQALAHWLSKRQTHETTPSPYLLTALPSQLPTAALRWQWESQRATDFATWCVTVLHDRFGVDVRIDLEEENTKEGPHYLRMSAGERQERCDWRYLNQSHWLGAFCTIIDRLLEPMGLTALTLETGWFDSVVVFCRCQHAPELLRWFPEAE